LKSALKGWCYYDANYIIKNASEVSKMFSHNGFQECSHHLYSAWQTFIGTSAGYFESNVA